MCSPLWRKSWWLLVCPESKETGTKLDALQVDQVQTVSAFVSTFICNFDKCVHYSALYVRVENKTHFQPCWRLTELFLLYPSFLKHFSVLSQLSTYESNLATKCTILTLRFRFSSACDLLNLILKRPEVCRAHSGSYPAVSPPVGSFTHLLPDRSTCLQTRAPSPPSPGASPSTWTCPSTWTSTGTSLEPRWSSPWRLLRTVSLLW